MGERRERVPLLADDQRRLVAEVLRVASSTARRVSTRPRPSVIATESDDDHRDRGEQPGAQARVHVSQQLVAGAADGADRAPARRACGAAARRACRRCASRPG